MQSSFRLWQSVFRLLSYDSLDFDFYFITYLLSYWFIVKRSPNSVADCEAQKRYFLLNKTYFKTAHLCTGNCAIWLTHPLHPRWAPMQRAAASKEAGHTAARKKTGYTVFRENFFRTAPDVNLRTATDLDPRTVTDLDPRVATEDSISTRKRI